VAFGESPPVFAKATRPLSTSVTSEAAAASVSNYQVNNNYFLFISRINTCVAFS
jgi:hypothetical protein